MSNSPSNEIAIAFSAWQRVTSTLPPPSHLMRSPQNFLFAMWTKYERRKNKIQNNNIRYYYYIQFPPNSSKPLNHHCTRSHHMSSSTNNLKSLSDRHLNSSNMPSRWYTVLALPFPDQKLGRRDINTFGRGVYTSRAGFFSNPLWVEANPIKTCHLNKSSRPM